ncbi:MAG: hypothetical protein AAFP19_11670 [Bacteroidota bacterium]
MDIKQLIKDGRIEEAIKAIGQLDLEEAHQSLLDDLSTRYNYLERSVISRTINQDNEEVERNKLSQDMLRLLKMIDAKQKENRAPRKADRWWIWGMGILLVLIISYGISQLGEKASVQYCIAAESFQLYSNAETYLEKLKSGEHTNASITISKNNYYIVCFDILADREKAIFSLERLKVRERNHKLWIHEIR